MYSNYGYDVDKDTKKAGETANDTRKRRKSGRERDSGSSDESDGLEVFAQIEGELIIDQWGFAVSAEAFCAVSQILF